MQKSEIIKKFEDIGLMHSVEPNTWILPTGVNLIYYTIHVDNYSFDTNKPSFGILIMPYGRHSMGTNYSFKLGVKEIQRLIEYSIEKLDNKH